MSDDKKYFDQEELAEAAQTIEFELKFYQMIAGCENFKVIEIADPEEPLFTEVEKQEMIVEAIRDEANIIFQFLLENGDSILFGVNPVTLKHTGKHAIIAATNYEYHC